ncbi:MULTISPECIES: hypothetical protein [Streptomyces]|uniref:hypothetical protein n=1 Tax=Streptomyces TaxID=1883 RepID=UPI001C4F546E|nr:hypothetical protein [Streptomyces sp. WY228]QXR01200.1 hypothetical protein KV381_35980 [Streptomyces sp. WY228]
MRKQMFRRRPAGGLAALLVLAGGPLAGCGIQETDVIQAGRPAVGDLLPPREGRVLLFYFSPDGELLPVPRIVQDPWQDANAGTTGSAAADEGTGASSPLAAVTALLTGPDNAERRAGLRNAPTLPRAPTAADRVVADGSTVEVELRLPVRRLAAPARDQLVCTAAYAAHTKGAVSVSLVGQDGRLAPADCPVRPAPAPAR